MRHAQRALMTNRQRVQNQPKTQTEQHNRYTHSMCSTLQQKTPP